MLRRRSFRSAQLWGTFFHRVEAHGQVTFTDCVFHEGSPHNLVTWGTVLLHCCPSDGGANGNATATVGGVRVVAGVCAMVDCTLRGGRAAFSPVLPSGSWVAATPAVAVVGGTLLLSHGSATGGGGAVNSFFGSSPPSPGVHVTGGSARITDALVRGGAGQSGQAGAVALVGTSATHLARTVLVGGSGIPAGAGSSGAVQNVPQLVGIHVDRGFRLGQTATVTAIAGTSQLLGVLAGFDGAATTHPAVVDPIVGTLTAMVTLALATPVAGAAIAHPIVIPSQPQLLGAPLFVQAFQLDGAVVRASAAVGGALH